jgi:hypothetical protein
MHPQLEAIRAELRSAEVRLLQLKRTILAERWPVRADPNRWSVAECVEHLNLTGRAYLPLLETAVAKARALPGVAPARYRRDPFGWLLWRMLGPPVRFRMPTTASFIPTAVEAPEALVAEFVRLQRAQVEFLEAVDGRPLGEVQVPSPFAPGRSYNLFSCFSILPRHQHRHLWQAEQVWAGRVE